MKIRLAFLGMLAAGAWFGVANAQTGPCAEDDLKCRIAQLEARLDALEKRPAPVAQSAPAATALPPGAVYAPEVFSLQRMCKVNCAEEALAECQKRGFAAGSVRNLDRPKTGPTVLTRISCKR
jgi:hypothetical protein